MSKLFAGCLVVAAILVAPPAHAQVSEVDVLNAVVEGDVDSLKQFLAEDPRAWDTGEEYIYESPVGLAIEYGHLEVLQLFVENGYNLAPRNPYENPVDLLGIYASDDSPAHLAMLQWFFEQGEQPKYMERSLARLVSMNHVQAAKILLDHGVDPNAFISEGTYSLLDKAESPEMRELLLSYGATRYAIKKLAGIVAFVVLVILGFIWATARLSKSRHRREIVVFSLVMLVVVLIIFLTGGGVAREFEDELGFAGAMIVGLVLFKVLPMLALWRVVGLMRRANMLASRDALAVLADDERQPILYLRSFQDDDKFRKRRWWNWLFLWLNPLATLLPRSSEEEQLTQQLQKRGPVVAIGDPGEELPKLGAHRMYVSHDAWQQRVLEFLERSQLVVLRIGLTEGILWELKNAIQQLDPARLIIWSAPGPGAGQDHAQRLADFLHEQLADILPHPVPPDVCASAFIYFKDDWSPIGVGKLDEIPNVLKESTRSKTQRLTDQIDQLQNDLALEQQYLRLACQRLGVQVEQFKSEHDAPPPGRDGPGSAR